MISHRIRHQSLRRISVNAFGLAALFALGGCISPDGKMAGHTPSALPPIDKATASRLARIDPDGTLPGVAVAANPSKERYTDPAVVSLGNGTPVNTENPAATGTAGNDPILAGQQQTSPANNLGELIAQPTSVAANRNSLFANAQTAYAAEISAPTNASSGSIVPQEMPTRRGINPSMASVFSAPRPRPATSYTVQEPMEPQPAPQAATEMGYDPAEPMSQPEAPKSAGGKRFSLMRILGKNGG